MRHLKSVDEVLQVLYPAWERYGVSQQAACNWRARERIPLRYFANMMDDLEACHCKADPRLWGVNGKRKP